MSLNPETMPDPSDADLVKAARAGDTTAFNALTNRYFHLAYAIGYSRLVSRESAEDFAQEIFLKAFLHLDKLQTPAGFAGWLRTMARNLAVDWLRKGRSSSELVSMVETKGEVERLPDPHDKGARDAMEQQETRQLVQNAIVRLPPELREVVLLHYLGDQSKSEVARQLDLHPATVGRQLKRALGELRTLLEPVVRETVRGAGPRGGAVARTAMLIAAASAMPPAAKASLAVASAASASLSLTATGAVQGGAVGGASGLLGWLHALSTPLQIGGTSMVLGKAMTAAVVTLAAVGTGVYYYAGAGGGSSPTKVVAAAPAGGGSARPATPALPPSTAPSVEVSTQATAPAATPTTEATLAPPTTPVPSPTSDSAKAFDRWKGAWYCEQVPDLQSPIYIDVSLRGDGKPVFKLAHAAEDMPASGDSVELELAARFPNLIVSGSSRPSGGSPTDNLIGFDPVEETAPGRLVFSPNRLGPMQLKIALEHQSAPDTMAMWMSVSQKQQDGTTADAALGPWTLTRWHPPAASASTSQKELAPSDSSQIIAEGYKRTRSDQRSIATALEAYFVDNNCYPLSDALGTTPHQLTTPIAYLTHLLPDPFASVSKDSHRFFSTNGGRPPSWIVVSPGSDGNFDITDEIFKDAIRRSPDGVPDPLQPLLAPFAYDPTNGTMSGGDIFRYKQ